MSIIINGNSNIDEIICDNVNLTQVRYNNVIVWNKGLTEFYIQPYTSGYVGFKLVRDALTSHLDKPFQYSFDRETWTSTTAEGLYNNPISVAAGQKIYFKSSTNEYWGSTEWKTFRWAVMDGSSNDLTFDIGGNYNSLFNYAIEDSRYRNVRAFYQSGIVDAYQCVFPNAGYIYERAFQGCTSLTRPPRLASRGGFSLPCVGEAFDGCTSLVAIPQLTGTTQTNSFANTNIFRNCTQLKFSETQTAECPREYRIPYNGTWEGSQTGISGAFSGTSGTYTGDLVYGTTYYTNATIVPTTSIH